MRLGLFLQGLTLPELEQTEKLLNLSDEEIVMCNMLSKRKSIVEIASRLNVSTRTVDRMIRKIKKKIK